MAELDSHRIAAAALAVVDKHGIAGFTMRAVADALGVTPMALYHHVKDKAALASLVVDAAIRQHLLPPPIGAWREDLWAMAKWIREGTLAHPEVGHLRREHHVWTSAMLQMTEHWLALWQQSGLELEQAVMAARMSSLAITGLLHEELILRTTKLPDKTQLAWLPNVRVMFNVNRDRDAEFEATVKSLIDGFYARLTSMRKRASRTQSKHAASRSNRRSTHHKRANE